MDGRKKQARTIKKTKGFIFWLPDGVFDRLRECGLLSQAPANEMMRTALDWYILRVLTGESPEPEPMEPAGGTNMINVTVSERTHEIVSFIAREAGATIIGTAIQAANLYLDQWQEAEEEYVGRKEGRWRQEQWGQGTQRVG